MERNVSYLKVHNTTLEFSNVPEEPSYDVTKSIFTICSVLFSIIATILITLILGYLNNVPIAKQCVILHLYKDLAYTVLLENWVISITIITSFFTGDGINVGERMGKVLSYCHLYLSLHFMLTVNLMTFMKFCMLKEKVLDPIILLDDDNENATIKKVRINMFVLFNLRPTCLYIFDAHSVIHSALTGEYQNSIEISTATKVFRGIQMAHLLFTVVTGIATKIYEQIEIVTLDTTTASLHILGEIMYIPIVVITFFILSWIAIAFFNFTSDINFMMNLL